MDRTALESNNSPSSRDWLNQTLKTEPFYPGRLCNSSVTATYFSTTSAGNVENNGNPDTMSSIGLPDSEYPNFPLHCLPSQAFQNAFVPPGPTETGTLTRAHAMHSLFETYTIEGGTTRQYTAVRMDHQIIPHPQHLPGKPHRKRRPSGSSTGGEAEAGDEEVAGTAPGCKEMTAASGETGASALSRASYMCRKCKAHGHAVPVKRHKRACPYLQCQCLKCRLVDQGRKVVARQIALYRDQKGHSCSGSGSNFAHSRLSHREDTSLHPHHRRAGALRSTFAPTVSSSNSLHRQLSLTPDLRIEDPNRVPAVLPLMSNPSGVKDGLAAILGSAVGPHCRRCRNHNVAVTWKGHKKSCPYRNCPCDPCRLINVRKDTEKTLRDMAGIEEKVMLPTTLSLDESATANNLFPYLAPVNGMRSPIENHHNQSQPPLLLTTDHQHANELTWTDQMASRHVASRKPRSVQDINAPSSPPGSPSNGPTSLTTNEVATADVPNVQADTSPVRNTSSPAHEPHSSNFEQYNQRSTYNNAHSSVDEKAHRPMLPFWQSFGHFDEKHTPSQGYIGGYYGLDNGHVFHGNGQSHHHHIYSPERVSAVAAAAAAAAAMVAMNPPIAGAYQQPYYGGPPQSRGVGSDGSAGTGGAGGGGFCHHRQTQQGEHPGNYGEENFNAPITGSYPGRSRSEDCWSSSPYSWGAYRYPYVMRGLPFNHEEHMETYPSFPGQRTLKNIQEQCSKQSDDGYARPVAHMWRNQLQHLGTSNLGVTDCACEMKRTECEAKLECGASMKADCVAALPSVADVNDTNQQPQVMEIETQRQSHPNESTVHPVINPSSSSAQYTTAFSRDYSQQDTSSQSSQQPKMLFETAVIDPSNQPPPYQQPPFEHPATTSPFISPINETQSSPPPRPPPPPPLPHSFHPVGTET